MYFLQYLELLVMHIASGTAVGLCDISVGHCCITIKKFVSWNG